MTSAKVQSRISLNVKDIYLEIMRPLPLARVMIRFGLLLIVIVLSLVLIPDHIFKFELKDALQDVFQILSFLIAALMVVVSIANQKRETTDSACQQIYQRLELESINLFRFDIDHLELASYIWGDRPLPNKDDTNEKILLQQYVAQILNLFEMAVRFRKDDIMPHDVFGSWVIWIDSLCESKNFCAYWREYDRDLRWNYIPELRGIINDGLKIHHGGEPANPVLDEEKQKKTDTFFKMVSDRFKCTIIREWCREERPC
jgi:hypothetical protein